MKNGEKKSDIYSLGFDIARAFESVGASIMSKDKASRLHVYLQYFSDEQVVLNSRFIAAISMAAGVLNIAGGAVPDYDGAALINKYTRTCFRLGKINGRLADKLIKPRWVADIEEEYGLRPNTSVKMPIKENVKQDYESRLKALRKAKKSVK